MLHGKRKFYIFLFSGGGLLGRAISLSLPPSNCDHGTREILTDSAHQITSNGNRIVITI
jgi:hypothetical protein